MFWLVSFIASHQATECGTKQIDEDGLLELIRTREKGPVVPVTPKIITSRPKKGAKKSPPDSGSPTVGTPSQVPSTPSQAPSTPSQGVSTTPVQTPLQNATALAAGDVMKMCVCVCMCVCGCGCAHCGEAITLVCTCVWVYVSARV